MAKKLAERVRPTGSALPGLANLLNDRLTLTWQKSIATANTQLRRLLLRRRNWVLAVVTEISALDQGACHAPKSVYRLQQSETGF